MKINYVKLKNFCSIKDSLVEFNEGINLIVGDNYVGKTTLFKAIALLLFNYTKGKLEDYIQWGKTSYEIEIDLDHNGKHFNIKYSYSVKASKRVVEIDDNIYDSNKIAQQKLAEHFDPKYTFASVISFERELDLVNINPADRREQLKKIRNLEFKNEIKQIEEELEFLEKDKTISLDKDIAILENKEYDIKELKELPFNSENYSKKESELEHLNREIQEYSNVKNKINELTNKQQLIRTQIDETTHEKLKLKSQGVDYSNKISSLDYELKNNSFGANLETYKSQLNEDHNIEVNKLEQQSNNIILQRVPIFDNIELKKVEKESLELTAKLMSLKQELALVKQGNCPTCGQPFKSSEDDISIEIGANSTTLESIQKRLKELKEEFDKYSKMNIENEKLNNLKQQLHIKIEAEKKAIQIKIQTIKDNIEKEKKNIEIYKQQKEESIKEYTIFLNEGIKTFNEANIKLISLNEENNKIEKEITKINSVDDYISKLDLLEKQKLIVESSIDLFKAILIKNNLIKEQNEKVEKIKIKDQETFKELQKNKSELIQEITEYKEARDILRKKFPNFILKDFIQNIKVGMNNFLSKTYNENYEIDIIEKKDSIHVVYGPYKKDVYLASGYESALFSLAYKDALNRMQNLNLLILDEVDQNANDKNCIILYEHIGSLKKSYTQILLITHREIIKDLLINSYDASVYEVSNGQIVKEI